MSDQCVCVCLSFILIQQLFADMKLINFVDTALALLGRARVQWDGLSEHSKWNTYTFSVFHTGKRSEANLIPFQGGGGGEEELCNKMKAPPYRHVATKKKNFTSIRQPLIR